MCSETSNSSVVLQCVASGAAPNGIDRLRPLLLSPSLGHLLCQNPSKIRLADRFPIRDLSSSRTSTRDLIDVSTSGLVGDLLSGGKLELPGLPMEENRDQFPSYASLQVCCMGRSPEQRGGVSW